MRGPLVRYLRVMGYVTLVSAERGPGWPREHSGFLGLAASGGRILLSRGANLVARTLLGLKARDATAGFRLYRREVLLSIPLDEIFSSGYSFLVEMLFLCQRRGWQIGASRSS